MNSFLLYKNKKRLLSNKKTLLKRRPCVVPLFFTRTSSCLDTVNALDVFDVPSIKAAIKAVQKETGVKGKNLFMPIRIAVSGQMHGPELGETIELLGKEKALDHLNKVL